MKNKIVFAILFSSVVYANNGTIKVSEDKESFMDNKYIGFGISAAKIDDMNNKDRVGVGMINFGMNIDKYLSFEGRYYNSVIEEDLFSYDSFSVFVKPKYNYGNFNIYSLLGVGKVSLSDNYNNKNNSINFQWGLGLAYELNEKIETPITIYVDYTVLGNNLDKINFSKNVKIENVNIGVSYRF